MTGEQVRYAISVIERQRDQEIDAAKARIELANQKADAKIEDGG